MQMTLSNLTNSTQHNAKYSDCLTLLDNICKNNVEVTVCWVVYV
jgi:hypothetical protein